MVREEGSNEELLRNQKTLKAMGYIWIPTMTSATHMLSQQLPRICHRPTMTHPNPPLLLCDPHQPLTSNNFNLLVMTHTESF